MEKMRMEGKRQNDTDESSLEKGLLAFDGMIMTMMITFIDIKP